MAPHEGERVAGRYRLEEIVGRGGMGVVWRATDTLLERVVAVKRVRLDELDDGRAQVTLLRVMREARVAARLHHPGVVTIFDVVEHDGGPWLVLEYVPSRSLAEIVDADGVLAPEAAARVGAVVADALDAAHAVGIAHRDVKPANVLVGDGGAVKLTDFGISRVTGDLTLTSTGLIVGTPAYLAPEVAAGGDATSASDVFGLGATLYAAVEGEPPCGGADTNVLLLLRAAADGRVRPPQRAGPLTDALLALLRADPAERPTAGEARELLAAVAGRQGQGGPRPALQAARTQVVTAALQPAMVTIGPARRRTPLVLAGVAAVLVVALAVALVVALRPDRPRGTAVAAAPAPCDTSLGDLRIGVIAPLTGDLGELGQGVRNSVDLAVAQANARCAVTGHRLVVDPIDDQNDPAVAAEGAVRISESSDLLGVVGALGSATTTAVQPVLDARGVVQITPSSTGPKLTMGPDPGAPRRPYPAFFRTMTNDLDIGSAVAEHLAPLALRRVVTVDDGSGYGASVLAGFLQRAQQHGFTVLAQEQMIPGTDPAPLVERIGALEPQVVFFPGDAATGGRLSAAMAAAGLAAPLAGSDALLAADYVSSGGREGDIAALIGAPTKMLGESGVDFQEAYRAGGYDQFATEFGPFAHDAAAVLIEAASTTVAGRPWQPELRGDLRDAVQRARLDGVTGPVAFDAFGDPEHRLVTVHELRNRDFVPVRVIDVQA
jgi:ABC-type branched-subunit amino acid transport system substrate-binding protein/tRNA A-37 threonylcarbamoyl transferase component Bud32